MAIAQRPERCAVCLFPVAVGKAVFKWKPPAAEVQQYKTVHVHGPCRQRLVDGHRPDGVIRLGLTPAEALDLVVRCEALRWSRESDRPEPVGPATTWSAYRQKSSEDPPRRPLKRDLRAARDPYAEQLRHLSEAEGVAAALRSQDRLLTYDQLGATIDYMLRLDLPIDTPAKVVETLRDLRRRDRMHNLIPPSRDLDWELS